MIHITGTVGQFIAGDLNQTFNVGRGGVQMRASGVKMLGYGAVGSGRVATEKRPLSGVPTRLVSGIGLIEVTVGPPLSCEVSADDNLLPQLVTKVDGDTLRIEFAGSAILTSPMTVRLTLPALDRVSVKGVSTIRVAKLQQQAFRCKVSGAGTVTVAGSVDEFSARLSGAGDIDAENLCCRRADLEVSGAGDLSGYVSEAVHLDLSGVGKVRILGNPPVREVEMSGLGKVKWS